MRVILYSDVSNESKFDRYIDIGSCERHYDYLCLFESKNETYENWYSRLLKEPLGSQILSLNYYLLEYENGNFEEIYGEKLFKIISKNYRLFKSFNDKWFSEPSLFNGLDLNCEDIEDRIESSKEDKNGNRLEITFEDNTSLKFLDKDDSIRSFYVLESEYNRFEKDVNNLISKFKED